MARFRTTHGCTVYVEFDDLPDGDDVKLTFHFDQPHDGRYSEVLLTKDEATTLRSLLHFRKNPLS